MPYKTDERLKSYLDTNQLHREQMCRAVLALDKRFSEVNPRHPRGGPDGARDIQAIFRETQIVFGAVGFLNQANDSKEQKKKIKKKFSEDLKNALDEKNDLEVFVFLSNVNLTVSEKQKLIDKAQKKGILYCEIIDRERIRILLDSPDGFSIRFQYLNITLSEAEQASFFSRWGDDIQSLISSGFQKIDSSLERLLFLQESNNPISQLTFSVELDKKYPSNEIDHFRLFCYLFLKEPKKSIISVLFGASDKPDRLRKNKKNNLKTQKSGIENGISFGAWEQNLELDELDEFEKSEKEDLEWNAVNLGSSIGKNEIEFITISYSKSSFIRFYPVISLKDLDDSSFVLFSNESLAEKIKSIHIYCSGYKLLEISSSSIHIGEHNIDDDFPVEFDENELKDKWVRISPKRESSFHIRFFEHTPKRLFTPKQVESSLEKRINP
jgi:hypothetical protein